MSAILFAYAVFLQSIESSSVWNTKLESTCAQYLDSTTLQSYCALEHRLILEKQIPFSFTTKHLNCQAEYSFKTISLSTV